MTSAGSTNVLLVLLGPVRAANTSLHGYERRTTPELDTLADCATRYHHAKAPSNWTVPSAASLFTGVEAHRHQFTEDHRYNNEATVFGQLSSEGVETGLFADEPLNTGRNGLRGEFEHTESPPTDANGFQCADAFLDWIDDAGGSWAACVSLPDVGKGFNSKPEYDLWSDGGNDALAEMREAECWELPHITGKEPPWKPSALVGAYDGAIRQTDAAVGEMIAGLRDRGEYNDTLIIVTSESGLGLGEFSPFPSAPPTVGSLGPLAEVLLHVPLLVKAPGQTDAAVIDEPVSLTGLPTAIESVTTPGDEPLEEIFRDETVTASTREPPKQYVIEAKRLGLDTTAFGVGRAAYLPAPTKGAVIKYEKWNGKGVVKTVHRNGTATVEGAVHSDVVDGLFEEEEPEPVGERAIEDKPQIEDLLAELAASATNESSSM